MKIIMILIVICINYHFVWPPFAFNISQILVGIDCIKLEYVSREVSFQVFLICFQSISLPLISTFEFLIHLSILFYKCFIRFRSDNYGGQVRTTILLSPSYF